MSPQIGVCISFSRLSCPSRPRPLAVLRSSLLLAPAFNSAVDLLLFLLDHQSKTLLGGLAGAPTRKIAEIWGAEHNLMARVTRHPRQPLGALSIGGSTVLPT